MKCFPTKLLQGALQSLKFWVTMVIAYASNNIFKPGLETWKQKSLNDYTIELKYVILNLTLKSHKG